MSQQCPHCNISILNSNFTIHEVRCSRDLKPCPHCKAMVHSSRLNDHKKTTHSFLELCLNCKDYIIRIGHDCPKALVLCDYCVSYIPNDQKQSHEYECGKISVDCTKCMAKMTRMEYLSHLNLVDCTKILAQFPEGLTLADFKTIFGGDFSQLKMGILDRKSQNNELYVRNLLAVVSQKSGTDVRDLIETLSLKELTKVYGYVTLDEFLLMPEFEKFVLNRKAQLVWNYLGSAKILLITAINLLSDGKRNVNRIISDFDILNSKIQEIIEKNNAAGIIRFNRENAKDQHEIINDSQFKDNKRDQRNQEVMEFEEVFQKIVLGPNPLKKHRKKKESSDLDELGFKKIKIGKNPMKRLFSSQVPADKDELTELKCIIIGKNPLKKLNKVAS